MIIFRCESCNIDFDVLELQGRKLDHKGMAALFRRQLVEQSKLNKEKDLVDPDRLRYTIWRYVTPVARLTVADIELALCMDYRKPEGSKYMKAVNERYGKGSAHVWSGTYRYCYEQEVVEGNTRESIVMAFIFTCPECGWTDEL